MNNAATRWLLTYGLGAEAPRRAFMFPFSGGNASYYAAWARSSAGSGVDLIGVQPPGRGARLKEPLIDDLETLIAQLVQALRPWLDRPFRFFGHSLGAMVAYETARALVKAGAPAPEHLFVSAFRAPDAPNPHPPLHAAPEQALYAGLARYGGAPREIVESAELRAFFAPMLRADLRIYETYAHRPGPLLSCPITALAGADDTMVPPAAVTGWERQTQGRTALLTFPGGHFFLNDHKEAILARLTGA